MQGILNVVVSLSNVRARISFLYEDLDGLTGPRQDGQHEGSVAVRVLLRHQSLDLTVTVTLLSFLITGEYEMIQNDVDNLVVPLLSSSVKDSLLLIVLHIDPRPFLQQCPDHLLVAVRRGYLERRGVLVVSDVQCDPSLAGQTLHHPDVPPHGGVVEGAEPVLVRLVHVRPGGQQGLHHQDTLVICGAPACDVPLRLILAVPVREGFKNSSSID